MTEDIFFPVAELSALALAFCPCVALLDAVGGFCDNAGEEELAFGGALLCGAAELVAFADEVLFTSLAACALTLVPELLLGRPNATMYPPLLDPTSAGLPVVTKSIPWSFYFTFTAMVFSHHTFLDMPNPAWLQLMSQTASFGIVFPSGLTIMTIMMYLFRSRIKWNITSLFILSGIAGWAFGGFAGTQTGWQGIDVYLHNTLNIAGHIHLVLLMGSVLFGLGLVYSVVPAITKKRLGKRAGFIHLMLTLIGGFGLALMFLYLGFAGAIRREAEMLQQFMWAMPWLLFFATTVGIGQLFFA